MLSKAGSYILCLIRGMALISILETSVQTPFTALLGESLLLTMSPLVSVRGPEALLFKNWI
jgi:hypothetical protein